MKRTAAVSYTHLSTMLSGCIGSVPTTTYGENIGVMAMTGVYSVRVIAGAAVPVSYTHLRGKDLPSAECSSASDDVYEGL